MKIEPSESWEEEEEGEAREMARGEAEISSRGDQ